MIELTEKVSTTPIQARAKSCTSREDSRARDSRRIQQWPSAIYRTLRLAGMPAFDFRLPAEGVARILGGIQSRDRRKPGVSYTAAKIDGIRTRDLRIASWRSACRGPTASGWESRESGGS